MRYLTLCGALLCACVTTTVHAQEPKGWRWYNEPKTIKVKPKPILPPPSQAFVTTTPPSPPPTKRNRTLTATEQMQWFQGYMAEVQNDAVINSADVNKVMKFMELSQFIDGKTTEFGMSWKEALLLNPSLDYRTRHPIESIARQTQNAQIKHAKIQSVQSLKEQGFGLFFAYNGNAPLDKALAPSIQAFADEYQIELLGITMDKVPLDSIRENRDNNGTLDVEMTPALVLVNPNTGQMHPLAFGFISQEELLGRFHNVATQFAPDF